MRSIKYIDGDKSFTLTSDDEICYKCNEIGEIEAAKAKAEALEKRKKK